MVRFLEADPSARWILAIRGQSTWRLWGTKKQCLIAITSGFPCRYHSTNVRRSSVTDVVYTLAVESVFKQHKRNILRIFRCVFKILLNSLLRRIKQNKQEPERILDLGDKIQTRDLQSAQQN